MTMDAVVDKPITPAPSGLVATTFLAVLEVLKNELGRNMSAYFLIVTGVGCIWFGSKYNFTKLTEAGTGLQGAALLAFQAKRTPDGNTTTVSTTVPPPNVAALPPVK